MFYGCQGRWQGFILPDLLFSLSRKCVCGVLKRHCRNAQKHSLTGKADFALNPTSSSVTWEISLLEVWLRKRVYASLMLVVMQSVPNVCSWQKSQNLNIIFFIAWQTIPLKNVQASRGCYAVRLLLIIYRVIYISSYSLRKTMLFLVFCIF